jgi:hypothetical protein
MLQIFPTKERDSFCLPKQAAVFDLRGPQMCLIYPAKRDILGKQSFSC